MRQIRLIYSSRPTAEFHYTDLGPILRASARNNVRLDITGVMALSRTHFIQILEGGREAVSHLYSRISRDPRHRDIVLYGVEEIPERAYSRWRMGFVGVEAFSAERCLRLVNAPKINPQLLDSRSLTLLIDDILRTETVRDAIDAQHDFTLDQDVFEIAV